MARKRRSFTKRECADIKKLLEEKLSAPENEQEKIRKQLRNKYGFWISLFTSEKPFSSLHFDDLIKNKTITYKD